MNGVVKLLDQWVYCPNRGASLMNLWDGLYVGHTTLSVKSVLLIEQQLLQRNSSDGRQKRRDEKTANQVSANTPNNRGFTVGYLCLHHTHHYRKVGVQCSLRDLSRPAMFTLSVVKGLEYIQAYHMLTNILVIILKYYEIRIRKVHNVNSKSHQYITKPQGSG